MLTFILLNSKLTAAHGGFIILSLVCDTIIVALISDIFTSSREQREREGD